MKHTFFILLCLIFGISVSAQETKIYLGMGGMYSSFQDTRFSDIQFNKLTLIPEIGFSIISENNYWHMNAYAYAFNEKFPNEDTITYSRLGYNVRFGYLRILSPTHYIGLNWDIVDYSKRTTGFLDNGSDSYKLSSDIYVSGKYLWDMNENWQLRFGLDYGIFTFVNIEPSFGANFQQNIIDNGQVTFVDEETKRPWKLQNMAFSGFWEQFNIRTSIQVDYKKKFALRYSWDLRRFADIKDYPVTDARHQLTLIFNIVNH